MLDVRDLEVDLTDCDAQIQRVLDASKVDGRMGTDSVADRDRRPTRRACLRTFWPACKRVRPTANDMLIDQVKDVFMVFNDRAYMKIWTGAMSEARRGPGARSEEAVFSRREARGEDPRAPVGQHRGEAGGPASS